MSAARCAAASLGAEPIPPAPHKTICSISQNLSAFVPETREKNSLKLKEQYYCDMTRPKAKPETHASLRERGRIEGLRLAGGSPIFPKMGETK